MIQDDFDSRTLTAMNMALNDVCLALNNGVSHDVRRHIAEGIIQSARRGGKTVAELTAAGQAALLNMPTEEGSTDGPARASGI